MRECCLRAAVNQLGLGKLGSPPQDTPPKHTAIPVAQFCAAINRKLSGTLCCAVFPPGHDLLMVHERLAGSGWPIGGGQR